MEKDQGYLSCPIAHFADGNGAAPHMPGGYGACQPSPHHTKSTGLDLPHRYLFLQGIISQRVMPQQILYRKNPQPGKKRCRFVTDAFQGFQLCLFFHIRPSLSQCPALWPIADMHSIYDPYLPPPAFSFPLSIQGLPATVPFPVHMQPSLCFHPISPPATHR